MSCKFSRNTVCTGKLRKLESLSPEDTEILSSEHGFLRSSITVQFEICDHQYTTMHKPKRRTGEDGLIVESVVFRPQLLPTREHLLLGIGKLLPKSWKGFILARDLLYQLVHVSIF